MANTVAVGALGLIAYDFDLLAFILKSEFSRHGEKVVNENIDAARAGYDFTRRGTAGLAFPRSSRKSGTTTGSC